MRHWEWHDFDDHTGEDLADEHDPHACATDIISSEYVTRDFWVAKTQPNSKYTISFDRVMDEGVLQALLGPASFNGQQLVIPDSGAWIVTFDMTEHPNNFEHVELDFGATKNLITEVARAVYDHYNVSKAGLYCWYAGRHALVPIYDRALGFKTKVDIKQKLIPKTENLNELGDNGRGYAIITKYY